MVAIDEEISKERIPDGSSSSSAGTSGTSCPSMSSAPLTVTSNPVVVDENGQNRTKELDTSDGMLKTSRQIDNENDKNGTKAPDAASDVVSKSHLCDPAPHVDDNCKPLITSENETVSSVCDEKNIPQTNVDLPCQTVADSSKLDPVVTEDSELVETENSKETENLELVETGDCESNKNDGRRVEENLCVQTCSDTQNIDESISMETNSEINSHCENTDQNATCESNTRDGSKVEDASCAQMRSDTNNCDMDTNSEKNSQCETLGQIDNCESNQSDGKRIENDSCVQTCSDTDNLDRIIHMDTNSENNSHGDTSRQSSVVNGSDRSCDTSTNQEIQSSPVATAVLLDHTSACPVASPSKTSAVPDMSQEVSPGGSLQSKGLTSLVGYEVSSDSDNTMESDDEDEDEVEEIPVPSASTSAQISSTSAQISVPATPKTNGMNLPVIDLASDNYRYTIDIGSGSDDSESDSESSSASSLSSSEESSLSEDEIIPLIPKKTKPEDKPEKEVTTTKKKKRNGMLTPGELLIEDLPPIEELKISVPEEQAHVMGYILNTVERQVVVQGHHGIPPIDLESVLFLDVGKRVLGKIFDVFGHIQEPLYVVRFNSSDHVKEQEFNKGDPVFYAPTTEHTSYVLIDQLLRIKGSDASGLTGNEVLPTEAADFSDDEEEARARGHSRPNRFNTSSEYQPNRKRSRQQGNNSGEARGFGRGGRGGRDSSFNPFGRGSSFNPFSDRGMRPRNQNSMDQRPMTQQRFDPRNAYSGPSRFPPRSPSPMQSPPPYGMNNGDYGPGSFSPYPNHGDMNGNMSYDMKPHFGGQHQNGYPQCPPSPWAQQQSSSHFGGPPQFSNQRMGVPPPNSPMPQTPPPHCPPAYSPGPPHCPPAYSPGPPPYHPSADFRNMGPPTTPTPPCPPVFSPTPQSHSSFQNMGPPTSMPCSPSFSPRPFNAPPMNMQNGGPPDMPHHAPPVSGRPPHYASSDFLNMPPPPMHVDPGVPPPPAPGYAGGVWPPPSHQPPPPSHPPPHQPPPPPTPHAQGMPNSFPSFPDETRSSREWRY